LGIDRFLVWFDRDKNKAGQKGQEQALSLLKKEGFKAEEFDWGLSFKSDKQRDVYCQTNITMFVILKLKNCYF